MRPIDADEVIKQRQFIVAEADGLCGDVVWVRDIQGAPTIDAVPVVRCKDCKRYEFADNRAFGMPVKRCELTGFEDVDDNDFCSRGERREE